MKKEWKRVNVIVLSILFVFMFVMSVNVVSAVASFSESVTQFVTSAIDTLQKTGNPLFSVLFGTLPTSSGADLFMQVLVFLLVVLVIYAVTDLIPIFSGRHWIQTGVGIIIAIIGIRFLPIDFIKSFGFSISSGLISYLFLRPLKHNSFKYVWGVYPPGTLKWGSWIFPISIFKLQESAMIFVFSIASGARSNELIISSVGFKEKSSIFIVTCS